MIWFAIIAAAVLAAAVIWWTFVFANQMGRSPIWTAVATLTLCFGMFVGFWFGNGTRYAVSPTVEFQGFPIPLVIFVLEDGRWVDYIGFLPLALVNALLIAAVVLSPLSLVMLIDSLRRRRMAGELPRTIQAMSEDGH